MDLAGDPPAFLLLGLPLDPGGKLLEVQVRLGKRPHGPVDAEKLLVLAPDLLPPASHEADQPGEEEEIHPQEDGIKGLGAFDAGPPRHEGPVTCRYGHGVAQAEKRGSSALHLRHGDENENSSQNGCNRQVPALGNPKDDLDEHYGDQQDAAAGMPAETRHGEEESRCKQEQDRELRKPDRPDGRVAERQKEEQARHAVTCESCD